MRILKLKSKTTKILLFLGVILVAGLGVATYALHNANDDKEVTTTQNPLKASGTDIKVSTRSEETEGQTVQVPSNVPSGSIKNYTLITENENYKIRELDGKYTITLYAIINNPSESESYKQQLRDYKQAALKYLSQMGVNTSKASIVYDPAEAANY